MANDTPAPNWRNFVAWSTVGAGAYILCVCGGVSLLQDDGLGALLRELPRSKQLAAILGLGLIFSMALTGFISRKRPVSLRNFRNFVLFAVLWMAACGLLLIGLSLAGPGGVLPQAATLAGALVLIAVLTVLGIATWRLSDELGRTLSHEAGNMGFYLILVVGGGWATLAHLGFAAAPAPLDWLTMFTVLLFVASFIATGRRKLLTR